MKSSAPCPAVAEGPEEIVRGERRRPGRARRVAGAGTLAGSTRGAVAAVAALMGVTLAGCRMGDTVKHEDAGSGIGSDLAPAGAAPGSGGQRMVSGGEGGSDDGSGGQRGGSGGSDNTDSGVAVDGGSAGDALCSTIVQEHVAEYGAHTNSYCEPLTFSTNPPASGTHYGSWPAFKVYDAPVPWGYLLHALEHGAVVISYNCPDGCAEDLAAAKAFVASLPNKAGCDTPSVILSPEPSLDVRFGGSAWNDPKSYTLRASCFDRGAFARFYSDHVDRNYESTCGGGDWSSNHWCPPGVTAPCGSGCS